MTTLRQRFRAYRRADGWPQTPPSVTIPQWKQLAGAGIVIAVTAALSLVPAGLLITVIEPSSTLTFIVTTLLILALTQVVGKYLGAPVADHVLGIPREVSD